MPNEQFTYRPSFGAMVTVFARQLRSRRRLRLVKWIKGIEFVADFRDIGGGYGEHHKYFGRYQTLQGAAVLVGRNSVRRSEF